ncbi:MAG: hypothetical protein LWX55_16210, partial [Deltaproteobacteria bacterium]|nr:hypothetical protein [Deltaproteobacteria bacterium]
LSSAFDLKEIGEEHMADDKGRMAWGQIVITTLVTALLSLIVGIALYHYTSKSPDLVYEVFPPAHFTKQATQISIYNARVENEGSREAEDVQVYLELPSSCNIQDVKVDPSLKSISYTVSQASAKNTREVRFPRLNQGENSRFSVLVDKGEAAELKMEVRAKGVIGHTERKERSNLIIPIVSLAVALVGVIVGMIFVIIGRAHSERQIGDVFTSQKTLLDKELQLVRTRDKTPEDRLKEILINTPFRLFFNPSVPGLSKTKIVRFGDKGVIVEGRNNNESSWRIRNELLELVDSAGLVHSRFYYSPNDGRFYHTNDRDTGSIQKHGIRDQYLVPEDKSNK